MYMNGDVTIMSKWDDMNSSLTNHLQQVLEEIQNTLIHASDYFKAWPFNNYLKIYH